MNTLIIGAGGIGSYFAATLDNLIQNDQFGDDWDFTMVDDDTVELKNIKYQNFVSSDIEEYKVDALEERFLEIEYDIKRVDGDDLNTFDLIIICADNNLIRKAVYKNFADYNIPFIDSRSNGRAIGIYSSDTADYLGTLSDSDENFSCQFPYQLAKNEVELGNRIVADILAQKLLTYKRTNNLPTDSNLIF